MFAKGRPGASAAYVQIHTRVRSNKGFPGAVLAVLDSELMDSAVGVTFSAAGHF